MKLGGKWGRAYKRRLGEEGEEIYKGEEANIEREELEMR